MTDDGALWEAIQNLIKTRQEVLFYNLYKGVVISTSGTIASASGGSIQCYFTKYQGVCMQIENKTRLQTKLLFKMIEGQVAEIDFSRNRVTLVNLGLADRFINKRKHVRVAPSQKVSVTFIDHPNLEAEIADISENGVGILIQARHFPAEAFTTGKEISIGLMLPDEQTKTLLPLLLRGEVRTAMKLPNGQVRAGILLFPHRKAAPILQQYVATRKKAILKELDELYLATIAKYSLSS